MKPEPMIGEEDVRKAVGLALDGYYEERPLAETTKWSLDIWERTDKVARAAISAHLAALERAGWKCVPREPTEEMQRCGADKVWGFRPEYAPSSSGNFQHEESAEYVSAEAYRAMLAAAPPPQNSDEVKP